LKCHETLDLKTLNEFVKNYNLNEKEFLKTTSSFSNSILNYNKHQDFEMFYKEQLLLFHPFTTSEESQLGKNKSWHDAYLTCESSINHVCSKYFKILKTYPGATKLRRP
jgi:hypothetical protein